MPERKIIDRDTYRKIKKMSREELQAFLERYYANAVENEAKDFDIEELRGRIGAIKGIGEKRLDEIIEVIQEYLRG